MSEKRILNIEKCNGSCCNSDNRITLFKLPTKDNARISMIATTFLSQDKSLHSLIRFGKKNSGEDFEVQGKQGIKKVN